MFFTYKDYLPMEKSLPFEEMTKIHQQMMDEIGNDEDALELYEELIEQAIAIWYSGPLGIMEQG